jgi:hypothetical protein
MPGGLRIVGPASEASDGTSGADHHRQLKMIRHDRVWVSDFFLQGFGEGALEIWKIMADML